MQDVRDVYDATENQMRVQLAGTAELCTGRRYFVRADGFDVITTLENDLGKIQRWCEIAIEVRDQQ